MASAGTTRYVKAWQCIGCGKIEAPRTCVGIRENRKVEFVYAFAHEAALRQAAATHAEPQALVRQLAGTTPREGEWEHCYRALQDRARRIMAIAAGKAAVPSS